MARRYTTQLYYWKSGTEPRVNIVPQGTVQHFYSLSYLLLVVLKDGASTLLTPRLALRFNLLHFQHNITLLNYLMGKGEAMPSGLSIKRPQGSFNIFFG